MEIFMRGPDIYHMTCDICGKEETIVEKDPFYAKSRWTKHWSRVFFEHMEYVDGINAKHYGAVSNKLDLCPKCTKKFKKLIEAVELEESEEWI